jgi:hypothetical protein
MKTSADRLLQTTFVMITLAALAANTLAAPNPRAYGVGHPFELQDLPFGDFRDRMESLPEPARNKAMSWLHRFSFTEQDLGYLRVDDAGGIFYADTYLPDDTGTEESGSGEPGTSAVTLSPGEVFNLHSRPGASNILYLDFDGHLIPASTAWTSIDLDAKPYDLDGDPGTFSDTELANIAEIWRRIAEDFASFEVDITTQAPATFGPTIGRILITADTDANGNAMPSQGAGGVAYVGVWGRSDYSSKYSPALVYFDNLGGGRADYVAEAATHEAGHNLSLSHDATSGSSYYSGHGSGYVSWGPLMGTGYNRHVSQWSKGEYIDASQQQDDVNIIAGELAYRGDDHGDNLASASRMISDAAGNVSATTPLSDPDNLESDNKGVIETDTDMDLFYFDTTGGTVSLTITPAWQERYTRGGNLDIHAALYDINGTLLLEDDPQTDTDSTLTTSLPAGRYYLAIQGTDCSASPYTDYGSLGQYFVSGTLPAVNDGTAPVPDPMSWTTAPQANGRDHITMTATTANDDSGVVEYRFTCIAGPAGCSNSPWQTNTSFTATGLLPDSTYEYSVSARDAFLNETSGSASASATTAANLLPTATNDSASLEANGSLSIAVLANDSDPDGDTLTVASFTQGTSGSVTGNGSSVTYTPAPDFTGNDSFSYSVDDGFNGTATASVSVTVTAPDQAPVANPDSVTITRGDIVVIDVLANDFDPDGDALVITGVTSANKGTVSWQPGQTTITYAHNPKRKGSDSFNYILSGSVTGTVNITLGSGDSGGDTGGGGGKGNGKGGKTK